MTNQKQQKASNSAPTSSRKDLNSTNANDFEAKYVHNVYNVIASHFSNTRHRQWPKVVEFLNKLPDHSLVADIGCGNGKYMQTTYDNIKNRNSNFSKKNDRLCMIGIDASIELIKLCHKKGHEVLVANNLTLPFHNNTFNAAISIAVLHHLSTQKRRQQALQEIIRILKVNGTLCLYVWSFEEGGRRKGIKPTDKEAYIPWNMPKHYKKTKKKEN